ncbi:Methylosome subunit pICln [Coemansia sp. RSA 1752]|nr:Methylosome subunit pICln [Coemansia sp. RSA 1752]KAJ1783331.1 Methylosome subunit pICln [Coemansia sp. RSA 1938]KAJ2258173.1 Methylosome subunit pICln [Coemansia sp. RSA 454]
MTVIVLRSAPDTTGIRFSLDARVVCVPDSSYANITGTLYVGEQRVSFYSLYKKIGFSLNYQNIVIHAVVRSSTDDEPHLYCQLDGPFPGCQSSVNGANESEDEDSEDEEFAELKFYPSDTSQLDALFQAMSDCAAMNPDTDTDEDDGDESDVQAIDEFDPASFITSEDQLDQLTPQGRQVLEHLESVIVTADTSHERFADAEDAEQE